jgi:hypothetical protein
MSLLRTTRGGKQVDLALNGGAVLGAAPGCQIIVSDPAAAPKQCKIVKSPKGYVLIDLTSAGTVVNGAKVREHVLRAGDVVQVGSEKFVFTEKAPSTGPGQAPEPVAAGVKAAASGSGPAPAAPGGRRPLPSRAPGAARPGTGQVPKAANGSKPAVRKLTAKPGSVARVHKAHDLFALPSTAKGRMIAMSVAIGLVLLGGGLFFISAGTVNSDQVKAAAKEHVARFNKIPETDIVKRLEMADEILSNADYVKYAKGEIHPVEKLRPRIKEQVDLEKRADQVLVPFLNEYKTLKAGPPEEYNRQADRLWDLVNVHLDNFKSTKYASQLEEIRAELKELLEKRGLQTWSTELPGLIREVQKQINANNYSQAMIEIDAFAKKFDEKESNQLKTKLAQEREKVKDSAKSYVERVKGEAAGKSTKDEKRRVLEAARPHVKGIADAERNLERAISDVR